MRSTQTTEHVMICGIERKVNVTFDIVSFGHSGGWDEPPEGASIEIEAIHDAETDRDLTEFCMNTRNLWGQRNYHSGYWHQDWKGQFVFNYMHHDETIADAIEESICERISDFEDHEPDYDYSYEPDTRGEYDV